LRSFQNRLWDFRTRGVRVAAISVDPPSINREFVRKMGFNFRLLSDESTEVIRRYDVLHPGAGPKHTDIARPAEFYIDSGGIVQWVNLTGNIAVRARPEEALRAIDTLRQ
jgi:peroxiredoxin